MKRRFIGIALALAPSAFACSVRPGSMVIFQNGATTLVCAGLSIALTTFAFLRKLPVARKVCLGLLILHPTWTMIGACCDCGSSQMAASVLDAILSIAVFNWDMLRRREGDVTP